VVRLSKSYQTCLQVMNNKRVVKKSAMIQRRCRAMIVQDDSEVSVIDGNIEQAEDGNKSAMIQVDVKKKIHQQGNSILLIKDDVDH